MSKESIIKVGVSHNFEVFHLFLQEHDSICDLMEEVIGHTDLKTLEDLLFRTHGNTLKIYDENDLDQVRSEIPNSQVKLVTLTEDEALALSWDLLQAVKEMRAKAIQRLSLVR